MVTLKYLGVIATTFNGIGEVQPQGTFEVEDGQAGSYLRRADIERMGSVTEDDSEQESTATDAE